MKKYLLGLLAIGGVSFITSPALALEVGTSQTVTGSISRTSTVVDFTETYNEVGVRVSGAGSAAGNFVQLGNSNNYRFDPEAVTSTGGYEVVRWESGYRGSGRITGSTQSFSVNFTQSAFVN